MGSGGAGDRPLVVSYSTSPADVVYATDGRTEPASINISPADGVFANRVCGGVAGIKEPALARKFVDFVLDKEFQADIPLQMFVYPADQTVALPALFTQFAPAPAAPVVMDPAASKPTGRRGSRRGRMSCCDERRTQSQSSQVTF